MDGYRLSPIDPESSMNTQKRQIRAARKAKANRLCRWQGVPTPSSQFATQGVRPRKHLAFMTRAERAQS
jgi:hypothetical protein